MISKSKSKFQTKCVNVKKHYSTDDVISRILLYNVSKVYVTKYKLKFKLKMLSKADMTLRCGQRRKERKDKKREKKNNEALKLIITQK